MNKTNSRSNNYHLLMTVKFSLDFLVEGLVSWQLENRNVLRYVPCLSHIKFWIYLSFPEVDGALNIKSKCFLNLKCHCIFGQCFMVYGLNF